MRITCTSIDGFIQNLKSAKVVFRNTIHYEITKRSRTKESIRSSPTVEVFFHVGCIIDVPPDENSPEGGQYLLESGEPCGIDYQDSSQEFGGTERANELKDLIAEVCTERNLYLLPGTVSV